MKGLKMISPTCLHMMLFCIIEIELGSQTEFKNQDVVL